VRAREVKVRVPAGVADGQRIRVKGRGAAGANGGPPGDLYVIVHVRPHALFGRDGDNLTLRLPVTYAEAALGADVKVPTLDGPVTVRIPPGTPSGKALRVRSKGAGGKGDLIVTVVVQVPVNLIASQRDGCVVSKSSPTTACLSRGCNASSASKTNCERPANTSRNSKNAWKASCGRWRSASKPCAARIDVSSCPSARTRS
jgi:DnaJ-class molecular chaperone